MDPRSTTLSGLHVRLEPLTLARAGELCEAGNDDELWRYMPIATPRTLADTQAWIRAALEEAGRGSQVPFAIVHLASGRAVGSTRYMDIRREHRGLEVGWTWIARAHQRSAVNTECKLLLLGHAFDELGALRVQLKTDARNLRSQRAIERLGAVREGVLRQHIVCPDGHVRDSVMYSIVRAECPAVRGRLAAAARAAQGSGPSSR